MTGPHGSQPTAARQGAVCAPMPAGKPSAELGEILQQVLQGLSRGEESGAAPRVAVLLDRPQPHLSNWLGPALGARELIVCSMRDEQDEQDGCPEAEPVEYSGLIGPARVVGFTNQVDLHQALATHGRFDVLVDALTHSPGMRATSAQLFIGIVRDGGYYVAIDGAALGESLNTAGLISRASRSLAGLHGAAGELSGDERSYGEQVAALTVLDGGVVLRKRGDGFVKLRYAETPPILSARYGESWGRSLETLPARVTPLEVIGVTNNPGLCTKRFPRENRIPETSVLEYRDVCVAPRQVLVKDHLLLPNTFRLATTKRLVNTALKELNHYYAAPMVDTQSAPRREGTFFYLDIEYNRHFGHFMTEVVPRLYAWELARATHPDIRILTNSRADRGRPPAYQRILLEAYGIDDDLVEVITSPVKVGTLVCAMPLMQNGRFADPALASTCHRLRDGLLERSTPNDKPQRRLFISRKPDMWRECLNGSQVEECFARRGFTIIRPEGHSIVEQARMFYEADVVAGYIGSALYNIMFARRPIDVIGFINQSYLATNEYLICSALGHRLHLFYGDEITDGRGKDCEGRDLGVTNRDYVFNIERDGDQLDELLDSLEETWGES